MSIRLFDLIIGCGQGGGRIAKTFSDFYGVRGAYFNLTEIDFQKFSLAKRDTLIIDAGGSGRDPIAGEKVVRENWDEVSEHLDVFGKPQTVVLCIGGGGGSGVGFMWPLLEHFRKGKRKTNILLIYTLPQKREGIPVQPNAVKSLDRLVQEGYVTEKGIGTLLIDNDYCHDLYFQSNANYWEKINSGIALSLGRFVVLTDAEHPNATLDSASGYKSLDIQELRRVMFFGGGFLDIRETRVASVAELSEVKAKIKTASLLNSSMQIQTTKSYIISAGMPDAWKDKKGVSTALEQAFDGVSKMAKTPYSIQTSYYAPKLKTGVVSVLLAGLTKARSIDKQLKVAEKNVAKFKGKSSDIEFQIGDLEY